MKGLSQGRTLFPCLADVPLSRIEIFPISTSHGWTQAIRDKISPFSGWKNSHECVKTVWEHPRSSLRSLSTLGLMENLLPSSLNFGSGLYLDFGDQQRSRYTLMSWLNAGG